jgi:uncharacterized protein YdaT
MSREQFHVVPDGDEWKVEQGSKSSDTFDTKKDAVEHARQVAHEREPSQVVVHKRDGRIAEESTYRDDPYPPAG